MSSSRGEGITGRLGPSLQRVQGWLRPDRERRRLYGWLAALVFLGVAVLSARGLPPVTVQWSWIGLVALLVLVSSLILAAEYRVAAWLLGIRVDTWEAVRVTIISSVANLLPVPGSLVVRSEALRRRGSGLGSAVGSNMVMGVGWLGVALLLAGALLLAEGRQGVARVFLVCGAVVALVLFAAIRRLRARRYGVPATAVVLLVEAVYVSVSALRIFAVLRGLGMDVTFPQATALAVASALAAGVGFFPGGLGLREVLSGGLAVVVGLAPAVGAFAGVVDRVVALVVRAGLAGVLLGIDPRIIRDQDEEAEGVGKEEDEESG